MSSPSIELLTGLGFALTIYFAGTKGVRGDLTLLAVKAAIAAYRESLSDDLQGLTDMIEMAQAAVVQATGMD